MSTFSRNIFLLMLSIGLFSSCEFLNKFRFYFIDRPVNLENKIDTIEVTYISWACACANWLPTGYLTDPNYSTTENAQDCIYIEASEKQIKLPREFEQGGFKNRIRLIGSFYKEKGISRDYEQPTSQYPEKGKVFRYTNIEIIKPYTIWDYSNKEPKTITITKGKKLEFEK